MSISGDGQFVVCDGEGCAAHAALPVALHPLLGVDPQQTSAAQGWLFVVAEGGCRHFCPACMAKQLSARSETEGTHAPGGRPAVAVHSTR